MIDNIQKTEEFDDRIERFLRGDMNAEEEACFKEEIKTNPLLKARAEVISALVRGMKRKGRKEDTLIVDEVTSGSSQAYRRNRNRIFRSIAWACSIAALFVILFNVFSNSKQDKLDSIVVEYYTPFQAEEFVRGDDDSVVVAELTVLFNAVGEEGDCSDVTEKLESIYKSIDTDYTYRAYSNDVAWYLALSYIKCGRMDNAENVLNEIIKDNPESEIARKAECLKKNYYGELYKYKK